MNITHNIQSEMDLSLLYDQCHLEMYQNNKDEEHPRTRLQSRLYGNHKIFKNNFKFRISSLQTFAMIKRLPPPHIEKSQSVTSKRLLFYPTNSYPIFLFLGILFIFL